MVGGWQSTERGLYGRQTECLGEVEDTPACFALGFPKDNYLLSLADQLSDEGDNPVLAGVLSEFTIYDWSDDLLGT